jgi:hypothetical protein
MRPTMTGKHDPIMGGKSQAAIDSQLVVVSPFEDGSSTALLRRFLAETEYSDLLLVSKRKFEAYAQKHERDWRQLELPLDGCE